MKCEKDGCWENYQGRLQHFSAAVPPPQGVWTEGNVFYTLLGRTGLYNARRDNLDVEWGQLQLEQSAWSTHAFVERVASTKLRMATPPPKEIEIVSP